MKFAILVTDGARQIVLTPENDDEQHLLRVFREGETASVKRGQYVDECRGGYVREFKNPTSVMFVLAKQPA